MQVVDIYCRSATEGQDTSLALQAQEAECRAYCAEHGLTIGLVMHEVASGLTYKGRPVLDLIRARCRNHVTSGVVVTHADRITRNYNQFAIFLKEIEEHGAKLFCAKENIDNTPLGAFVRIVLAFAAEMEREHASR
ncbi:MAG TPA: recombinase family protein [Ktedonobacterales bacterium]|nr:recombinase family protein [Ktedonobacterales bacterium]